MYPETVKPRLRHYLHYLLGTVSAFALFTALSYVLLKFVLFLIPILGSVLGEISSTGFYAVVEAVGNNSLYVAMFTAGAWIILDHTVRWELINPEALARHERNRSMYLDGNRPVVLGTKDEDN